MTFPIVNYQEVKVETSGDHLTHMHCKCTYRSTMGCVFSDSHDFHVRFHTVLIRSRYLPQIMIGFWRRRSHHRYLANRKIRRLYIIIRASQVRSGRLSNLSRLVIIKRGNKSVMKSRKLSDSEPVTQLFEMYGVFVSSGNVIALEGDFIGFDSSIISN